MELPASWWIAVWNLALIAGIIIATIIVTFIFTLPSTYSHFHPRSLTEATFSESSKTHPEQSGYGHFTRLKDGHGQARFETSVQIVVLGDIGRSPRMQYHALSIAAHGGLVDVIGYTGSEVHPDIVKSDLINIIPIQAWPSSLQTNNRLLFLLLAPLKVFWQVWSLYYALSYRTTASKWMLVQNPPSIPTLLVAQISCYLRSTRLVIDWHNFGYSILALRLGPSHPFVRVSEWYEGVCARGAHAHICVTDAMARVLATKWHITASPLHDRPPSIFQPLNLAQRSAFLARLPGTAPYADVLASGACRLLVSSTSWTADEDFSILLDALVAYSSSAAGSNASDSDPDLPNLLAIITGRGPQRAHYLSRIASLTSAHKLDHVVVTTAWLTPEDYATLLGAADLGVSLHTSSSGVDLPMKVVDMFGTGLPVIGWDRFEAWPELVRENVNGRGFGSAAQLADLLRELFGSGGKNLEPLREGAMKECARRWDDEWMPVAGRLFQLAP